MPKNASETRAELITELSESKLNTLGLRLSKEFLMTKTLRRDKELEWVEALRQYKGVYSTDVKIPKNASHIYPKYTRSKVVGVTAKLKDMLLPDNDKNWDITPTASPEIELDIAASIIANLKDSHEQVSIGGIEN